MGFEDNRDRTQEESAISDRDQILEVLLAEYDKVKSEQAQRIGFRDNLLYVTLVLFGTIVSFAVSSAFNYYAFLVIPWVCIVLGWTYLVNDQKISSLGKYIRLTLSEKIAQTTGYTDPHALFGWEIAHRSDPQRMRRKIQQLIIDQVTFVCSGAIAIFAFWFLVKQPPLAVNVLCWVELTLLVILGYEMIVYADLAKGR